MKKLILLLLSINFVMAEVLVLKNGSKGDVLLSRQGSITKESWQLFCDGKEKKVSQEARYFYLEEREIKSCKSIEIKAIDKDGKIEFSFQPKESNPPEELNIPKKEIKQNKTFNRDGELELTWESDAYADTLIHEATLGIRGRAYQDRGWFYNYNFNLNSQNKEETQDINHYKVQVGFDNWFSLSGGDLYPYYHKYMIDGERVRGGELRIATPSEWISLDIFIGQNKSAIEPVFKKENLFIEDPVKIQIQDSLYAYSEATYKRSMYGARLQFGSGENFSYGIMYLKSEDHRGDFIDPWEVANLGTLSEQPKPEENLVIGNDLSLKLFSGIFEIYGGGFLSMHTQDKTLTLSSLDEEDEIDIGDIEPLPSMLTINNSTTPLPLDMEGRFNSKALLNATSFNAGTKLNISNRKIQTLSQIEWFRIGSQYKTLGNPYLQADRIGTEFSENIVLPEFGFFVNGTFGIWEDDLTDTKSSKSINYNWSLFFGYQPAEYLPGVNFNYSEQENKSNAREYENENASYIGDQNNNTQLYSVSTYYSLKTQKQNHYFNIMTSYNEFGLEQELTRDTKENFGSVVELYSFQWHFSQQNFPVQTKLSWTQSASDGNTKVLYYSPSATVVYNIIPGVLQTEVSSDYSLQKVNDESKTERTEVGLGFMVEYEPIENHTFRFENKEIWTEEKLDWRISGDYLFLF